MQWFNILWPPVGRAYCAIVFDEMNKMRQTIFLFAYDPNYTD